MQSLFRVITVGWAVLWSGVAGVAVIGVVMTAAEIQAATSDDVYFRGSARLWAFVGMVVAAMSLAVGPAMVGMDYPASVRPVVVGCIAVPAVVAVAASWHNALSLVWVRRRRSDALRHGDEFDAVVVEREHKPFAHDILAVTLEATLPGAASGRHTGGYRAEAAGGPRSVRIVETCPGDQWARLTPGRRVRVRIDPANTSRYALVLFDAG